MKVSFYDYVPVARFDNLPWTGIKIFEGAAQTGSWNLIDTLAINPLDTDPAHPIARSFTTSNATLAEGWYKIQFTDANSDFVETDPVQNAPSLDREYLPTLRQVGLTTIGRTVNDLGVKLGTFTVDTTPTDDQVRELTELAGEDVRNLIGGTIPSDLRLKAQRVIALRTAMMIELSFFGSEVAAEKSPYPQLKELYDELIGELQSAVASEEVGANVEDQLGSGTSPAWGFESPVIAADGTVGWMNRRM